MCLADAQGKNSGKSQQRLHTGADACIAAGSEGKFQGPVDFLGPDRVGVHYRGVSVTRKKYLRHRRGAKCLDAKLMEGGKGRALWVAVNGMLQCIEEGDPLFIVHVNCRARALSVVFGDEPRGSADVARDCCDGRILQAHAANAKQVVHPQQDQRIAFCALACNQVGGHGQPAVQACSPTLIRKPDVCCLVG